MNLSEVNEQLIYVDSFILSKDEVKDYNIEETFEKVIWNYIKRRNCLYKWLFNM